MTWTAIGFPSGPQTAITAFLPRRAASCSILSIRRFALSRVILSLDSHSFENFLDHCLACRRSLYCCHWFCLFSTGRSAFFLVLYRLLCGFCISGHDIQIITQTVHVFLCAVVCSEFHTDSCQITLRSPRNCSCDIQFCRQTAACPEGYFLLSGS